MNTPIAPVHALNPATRGFTMIELLIVLVVAGLLAAMGVPAYLEYLGTSSMRGAEQALAGEIRQMRARAMATGHAQTIHFSMDSTGCGDYHVHENGQVTAKFDLPHNVRWATTGVTGFTINTDGRASTSQLVVLQDDRGNRDTVSVELSGLVVVR